MEQSISKAIEQAEAEYLSARVCALEHLSGNPYGAHTRKVGQLRGFLVEATPSPMLNRICGDPTLAPVDFIALLDWFAQYRRRPAIPWILPQGNTKDVRGFGRHKFSKIRGWTHAQLYVRPPRRNVKTTFIEVVDVTADEIELFADIHADAFRTPEATRPANRSSFRQLLSTNRAKGFLARMEGKPAGIGLVYFASNGVAYMGTAATVRAKRGQGIHSAIIARRIAAARAHGSEFVAATAIAHSQSRRNLERSGLSVSHLQTLFNITA